MKKVIVLAVVIGSLLSAGLASAAILLNHGFETGNLTSWSESGEFGAASVVSSYDFGGDATVGPDFGSYFAILGGGNGSTGIPNTLSQSFTAKAGDVVSGSAFFDFRDELPFIDFAEVRVVETGDVLFSAGGMDVNWTAWSWTAPAGGTYTLEAASYNVIDELVDSFLGLDGPTLKGNVLAESGVPGKGLTTAPGLSDPFNEGSAATENAGKRDSLEVCHVLGNGEGRLLSVIDVALEAHLGHGDTLSRPPGAELGTLVEVESNDTIETAQPLGGGLPDACGRVGGIGSATIDGTGDGTFDYYSFDADAEQVIEFEILDGDFDTELVLYDSSGTVLTFNDDGGVGLLSKITHAFDAPATFIIGVGEFNTFPDAGGMTGNVPDPGDSYTLHIATQ